MIHRFFGSSLGKVQLCQVYDCKICVKDFRDGEGGGGSSKGISWLCSIDTYIFFNISYLSCLDLVLWLDELDRALILSVCVGVTSFSSL